MRTVKVEHLVCDGCGTTLLDDRMAEGVSYQVQVDYAAAISWTQIDGEDFCDECSMDRLAVNVEDREETTA